MEILIVVTLLRLNSMKSLSANDSFYDENALKLRIPCNGIIAGPAQSGKSTLVERMITNSDKIFHPKPKSILYAYGEYDGRIHKLQSKGVHVVSGVPSEETIDAMPRPTLIFLDDLMLEAKDGYLQDLFTRKSHHKNLAVFFVTQNLYSRAVQVARINSHYIFIMRAPNAALHIRTIGTQLFPGQLKYFLDAYHKATERPFNYILIDMHPSTPTQLRLRTDIMPDEEQTVFLPKGA